MAGGTPQPELRAQGVAVLLAYAAHILPPKRLPDGRWIGGVRCEGYRDVYVRAVGYPTPEAAERAEREAAEVLRYADLTTELLPGNRPGFVVRRVKKVV